MAADTEAVTLSDRELLERIYELLLEFEPAARAAAKLMDNPAARFMRKTGAR